MEKNIDLLYNCRKDFCVVALTGLSGSGCSGIAKMICQGGFLTDARYDIRKPSDVIVDKPQQLTNTEIFDSHITERTYAAIKKMVFKRKYTICYDYVSTHYEPVTLIKYNKVLWLYTLKYIENQMRDDASVEDFKNFVYSIIQEAYHPSYKDDCTAIYDNVSGGNYKCTKSDIDKLADWQRLYDAVRMIPDLDLDIYSDEQYTILYEIFFNEGSVLHAFYLNFNRIFSEKDYYCYCFFYHRLGVAVRSVGNPLEKFSDMSNFDVFAAKNDNIFCVVKLINKIIKSVRKNTTNAICRICIDSLRNSLESKYLSERYSAYYLIAVNDDRRIDSLKSKILKRVFKSEILDENKHNYLVKMQEGAERLCQIEADASQYEDGKFAGPNVAQCISDAEIHIVQPSQIAITEKPMEFYSAGEQWMKFAALILHPGLITPSSEERCMEVAFTAKLNSGCISRQVGAVITNKNHTIRSIGWNDVPYGQVPCALREIEDFIDVTDKAQDHKDYISLMYSDFELSDTPYDGYKDLHPNKSFKDCVCETCQEKIAVQRDQLGALPYSYCFKSLHNKFMGDKNQVFTRSLHAEENAMMQMVKFGGEGLMDGIIYVTASPCELCSKKLYQLGVRKIVYIDPYPGIAREQIIANGFRRPKLQLYKGAYGMTYYKLYQPFIAYKDELAIRTK